MAASGGESELTALGFTPRLIMRFGARETALPSPVLIVVGLLVFTWVRVDADFMSGILPVMLLLGLGAGLSFPSLMTPRDVGGRIERLWPRFGTGQHAAAGRWRAGARRHRDPIDDRTDGLLAHGDSTPSASTGGYHLAFGIGGGLVAAAAGSAGQEPAHLDAALEPWGREHA